MNTLPITFIKGNNFSGRSSYLEDLLGDNENYSLMIKELPTNNITGIFPTVEEEIKLHCNDSNPLLEEKIWLFLNELGFKRLYSSNPFMLSGGEQTLLVIACNLLLNPTILCIDTTIEQLNVSWYKPLFEFLDKNKELIGHIYISDNRFKEYDLLNINEYNSPFKVEEHRFNFEKPNLVAIEKATITKNTLSLNNLTFRYDKGSEILSNLNFNFESSVIYHLKGKNGAGKSTLAKILVGVLKVDKDFIYFNGNRYASYDAPGYLCGYSFQNPDEQLFSDTIEKEILPFIKNENEEYTKRRDDYILMFGLQNVRKNHPAEMPFVIRKRVALASTLAMDKPFYILDEPTLGQDDNFVEFLAKLLEYLKNQGKGIILITHCKTLIEKINLKELDLSQ